MGSPLTITVTVCACSCDPPPTSNRAAEANIRRERRERDEAVIVNSVSADLDLPGMARAGADSYWIPAALPPAAVLPSVRRPIWSMIAWFSTGGADPAEYAYEVT